MTESEQLGSVTAAASPDAVATAISGPQGLSMWLSDEARSEKRPAGRVVLWWNDGRLFVGRWSDYRPPEAIALRGRFDDADEWTTLTFHLTPDDAGTRIEARLEGGARTDAGTIEQAWAHALDDLKTYVESGKSGRYQRRPMLGINLEEVDEASAAAKGLPVSKGILVTGVVDESGAARAGISEGDILVRMVDSPLEDWASVGAALDGLQAGDTVPVRLWRDGQELTVEVTLGSREQPEVTADVDEIRRLLRANLEKYLPRLEEVTEGLSEAQAVHKPAEGEWSIKQVLGHLSDSERWFADDTARTAADEPSTGWAPLTYGIRAEALAALPLADLVSRLRIDLLEALAEFEHLLAQDLAPVVLSQIAESTQWTPEHFEEHMAQIESAAEAAKEAGVS